MHSRQLHVALRQHCAQVGFVLAGAVAQGAEVAYEVVPEGGRGSKQPLYCYRALTGEFVVSQRERLRALDTYLPALHALIALDNLAGYLDAHRVEHDRGDQRELGEAVLTHFLARVFDGGEPKFELTPERFEPAYRDLERICVDGRTATVVLGMLRGITTESEEVALAEGVLLAPPDCLEDMPPDPLWVRRDGPALVVAIAPGDQRGAISAALERMRELQRAMHLFAPGISLAPLAWVRGEGTPWRPLPLRTDGRSEGTLVVAPSQEDELRAFCSLVARRVPRAGPVAWALERFELGCQRSDPLGALTDHLLALRALLEPEGPRSGHLAGRLAALCAVPEERVMLAKRVAHAVSLEQSVIAGLDDPAPDALELAGEIEGHLRALLRDIVCGHLQEPVDLLADEILLEDAPPQEAAEPGEAVASHDDVPRDAPADRREATVEREALDEDESPTLDSREATVEREAVREGEPRETTVEREALHPAADYDDLEVWGEPAPIQPELFPQIR